MFLLWNMADPTNCNAATYSLNLLGQVEMGGEGVTGWNGTGQDNREEPQGQCGAMHLELFYLHNKKASMGEHLILSALTPHSQNRQASCPL